MAKIVSQEEIIERFKNSHGDRYDYSLVEYIKASKKVKIICKEHGIFEQFSSVHSKGSGCPKCAIKESKNKLSMGTEEFIKRSKKIHGNTFNYDKVNYINNESHVIIGCKIHGDFKQSPMSHLKGIGCKLCSKIFTHTDFINKAKEIHNDLYDYSLITDKTYINSTTKVPIICKEHGIFEQTPTAHINNNGCKLCAQNTPSLNDLIKLFNLKHNNKYNYSLINNSNYKELKDILPIICREHGIFYQSAFKHKNGNGCPKCANLQVAESQRFTYNDIIKKFNFIHNNRYDYSLFTNYENMQQKIEIICKNHGVFTQAIHNHIKFSGCSKCSSFGPSIAEIKIHNYINSLNIDCKFSNRTIIKPYELDIYLENHNLAIEINGVYWHSELFKDKNYHLEKTKKCKNKNVQLLHFWDIEVNDKFDIITSMINSKMNLLNDKIYARKCKIKIIKDNNLKNLFLDNNHLQGKCNSSINLGLFYNDELVSLMTFGKSRFNKNYNWELLRFCNKLNTYVVGGASKLFSYFINNFYNGTGLISYANLRYSDGNLYNKLGFKEIKSSAPSYFYSGNDVKYISRYNAQKHNLKNLLGDKFDSALSEYENMKNNGYYRVYDCGNLVYIYE